MKFMELKIYAHTQKNCTQIFIAILFIIAKTWKQPRCPSIGEWVNTLVHAGNRLLFSVKKKLGIKLWKDMKDS